MTGKQISALTTPPPPPLFYRYHCDYFGANTTFMFFLQTAAAGPISATVFVHTSWTNATIGVQLNDAPEQVVACPPTPDGQSWSACAPALLDAPAGVSVAQLRSIGWAPEFRTYSIANVSFAAA